MHSWKPEPTSSSLSGAMTRWFIAFAALRITLPQTRVDVAPWGTFAVVLRCPCPNDLPTSRGPLDILEGRASMRVSRTSSCPSARLTPAASPASLGQNTIPCSACRHPDSLAATRAAVNRRQAGVRASLALMRAMASPWHWSRGGLQVRGSRGHRSVHPRLLTSVAPASSSLPASGAGQRIHTDNPRPS